MGYEEVETVLPAGFTPKPDRPAATSPPAAPVEDDAASDGGLVERNAADEAADYPESEPEDAACGKKLRKKKKRTKSRGTSGGTDGTSPRAGRRSLMSRWRSSRSKSRGRAAAAAEGAEKGAKAKGSKLSFRALRKADSNATEKIANTAPAPAEPAGADAAPTTTDAAAGEATASCFLPLAQRREGRAGDSPGNTTGTASLTGDSPGAGEEKKEVVAVTDRQVAVVMAPLPDISIEVGDDHEQIAIAVESPFAAREEPRGEDERSVRSNRSTRSASSKASARSLKSKKSGESAGSHRSGRALQAAGDDGSVRSSRSNRSTRSSRSNRSTGSKRLSKASKAQDGGALVVPGSKELEISSSSRAVAASTGGREVAASTGGREVAASSSREVGTSDHAIDGDSDDEEAAALEAAALAAIPDKQEEKWVKKVSLSIGGYKTSFQFSDPMSNLAHAVNDALDVVGNGDENLVAEARRRDAAAEAEGDDDDGDDEERDYDAHPTPLFMHLQQRQWGPALARLQSHPAEARVWVYRRARPDKAPDVPDAASRPAALVVSHTALVVRDGTAPPPAPRGFRWRLLPLHAAIVLGAPAEITRDLVRAHPGAARRTDERGSLPVHLAASRLDVDREGEQVVLQLFGAYPDSIDVPDRKGRTPPELAKLARARKGIEEQRRLQSASSMASQVGMECTASQCGPLADDDEDERGGSGDADDKEEGGDGDGDGDDADVDDEGSVKSSISGRFRQMMRKSKSTDTADRRKKKDKPAKKSSSRSVSSAKSVDGMDDDDEVANDQAIAESLGPGFAFLTTSKSQDIRERAASDDKDAEEEGDDEPTEAALLKDLKRAMIGREYQMPTQAPAKPHDSLLSLPLPMSFCDDGSVHSSSPRKRSFQEGQQLALPRTASGDSASRLGLALSRTHSTASGDSASRSRGLGALSLSRTASGDSASKLTARAPSPSPAAPAAPSPKRGVTVAEEHNEVHEMACQTSSDEAADGDAAAGADASPPTRKVNEGLRVLLEKAVENAGRAGVDVTPLVEKLEDEWVTDVEALRRLDRETLDDLLPLMLSRELQRLINHADSIDVKFLEEERREPAAAGGARGRSPKKSGKKKKKKRSHRKVKKRGHHRPVTPPEGPLTPISEIDEDHRSPHSAESDDCLSVRTERRSAHLVRSAPPHLSVPDEDDEDGEEEEVCRANEERYDDEAAPLEPSASIEDLEIRKLHAHLIADARKKFPTREALEDSIAERQREVEAAVDSGFDVDKQTLARAALADDEVRKLLPLRLILPTVSDLNEMIGVLLVHKEGAMRGLKMDKAREIQMEIDELQDQISKEERYLLQKRMDAAKTNSSEKMVAGILKTSTYGQDSKKGRDDNVSVGSKVRADIETVESSDDAGKR